MINILNNIIRRQTRYPVEIANFSVIKEKKRVYKSINQLNQFNIHALALLCVSTLNNTIVITPKSYV